MSRDDAIKIIALHDFNNCSEEDRMLLIYNSWGIDETDEIFHLFPDDLKEELINYDEPQDSIMSSKYDNMVIAIYEISYDFYSNEEIEVILSNIIGSSVSIEGQNRKKYPCPCCKREIMVTRGEYDICSNCGWEDDGNEQEDKYSPPNHMTLKQGRDNYKKFGKCESKKNSRKNMTCYCYI